MNQTFPRRNLGLESLALAGIFLLHLSTVSIVSETNILYLGGDTAREAWRAWTLLKRGVLLHDYGAPYESDFYCLVFIPFLILFKNTILCLRISGMAATTATVLVLYAFIRRTYGLLAACCLGSIYATSPLLLAHAALGTEYGIPLWIGVFLLLDATQGVRNMKWLPLLAAGVFTSLNAYFILPLLGYLASKGSGSRLRASVIARNLLSYAIGLALLSPKFASWGSPYSYFGPRPWFVEFFMINAPRWEHPGILLGNIWSQMTWSLGSFLTWGSAPARPLNAWLPYCWLLLFIVGFLSDAGRRWCVAFAAGLLLAALFQSPTGFGARHLLAFLPFCWMMAAPLFREFPRLVHRLPLMLMTFLIVLHQRQICHRYSLHPSLGDRVIGNSQFLEKFLSQNPHKEITVAADNSNLYFDLKFFFPDKTIFHLETPATPQRERIGVIFVAKEKAPTHWSDLQRRPAYLLGKYNLSGGTSYDLLYEK
ncbi:MAG: hypothetical protein AAB268_07670 [Elusimicrobiota bacterium]